MLHAFRTEPQEEDPAFEKELAALVGGPRARQPVGAQAPPAAAAPASDLSGEDPAGEVAFQVVLRRGGSRDTQSRTVQVGLACPAAHGIPVGAVEHPPGLGSCLQHGCTFNGLHLKGRLAHTDHAKLGGSSLQTGCMPSKAAFHL